MTSFHDFQDVSNGSSYLKVADMVEKSINAHTSFGEGWSSETGEVT